MGEAEPLLALGVSPDSIWGDEDETIVYAQTFGKGRAHIFRFHLNTDNPPQSLPSWVVSCYHDLEVSDEAFTFQDRSAMRSAIWSAMAKVWCSCTDEPAANEPGAVIDLASNESGEPIGLAYREPLFTQYLDLLRNIQPDDLVARNNSIRTVDISDVTVLEAMGGRCCCKRSRIQAASGEPSVFVFKGIDFQTYLQLHDDDDEFARAMVESWRRSSIIIANMPPHPNIQSPPQMLVSIGSLDGTAVIMGHLSTFFVKGDLRAVIEASSSGRTQISDLQKAKWCHQMSLAIMHTHRVMHTFHMDIKPGNFIVDDEENLILIDWEQSGAPPTTLAPEADGTWDVNEQDPSGKQQTIKLIYTKYTGPERRNTPGGGGQESFNVCNVFPEWQKRCPKALELAEIFALGRTMWMLLSQTSDDFDEIKHPNDVQVTWENKDKLPRHWISMVEKCMEKDPNERPSLEDLAKFWDHAAWSLDSGQDSALPVQSPNIISGT